MQRNEHFADECFVTFFQFCVMFRFVKYSDKRDCAANAVRLTSYHMNGESAASSQQYPPNQILENNNRPAINASSGSEIIGPTGTVRGFKNIITQRKEFLRNSLVKEIFEEDEEGKIVVYTTSMGGIRSKVDECAFIRKLFDNLGLKVDERDIFMHKDYQCQLDKRLGVQNAAVPHVFVNGDSLGGAKELENLNETGELKILLQNFERRNGPVCQVCGGFRYINCVHCHGSKCSRKTRISRQISVLRCTSCNENGLQRCPECDKN